MYSEKLKQFKTTVSPETIVKIENAGTEDALRKLIAKYHIHIDLAEEAFSALMLMCYGALSSSECFNAIHSIGAVNDTDFVKFIQDVNEIVLKPLQNNVKAEVVQKETASENQYDKKLNDSPVEDEQPIEEFFESLGLNPDGSPKESAEETLARIEKEAEAEVEAEIRAEMEEKAKKQTSVEPVHENKPTPLKSLEHDIDLDDIPKSTVNTYNFVRQNDEPLQTKIEAEPVANEAVVENIDTVKNNSLDFIESKAVGNINLKPEPATPSAGEKSYYKDPYHESL